METAIVWCLVWGAVRTGAQTPATMGAGLTSILPTQQNLQSALFSIDERLRALDSYYTVRYGGRWDVETYVRRLESIETRIGRMETLLELRTDKLFEAITSYQMKDTQTKEHINRKIDSLYDRLIHRIAYMENRVDTDVAKIQSIIESGFVRISRAERESEIIDVETQLHDLQRQFEEFERNQNQTLTLLLESFAKGSSAKTVLNDETAGRETFRRDMDQFSESMENVATKVNKMFNDLNHQSQTLEGLVKNSMSLTNATRREIQEGFKTLGHRKIVMQQGNKQNKEKEAASSLEGWDALSNLLSKEFGNLVRKIDSNYEELTKDHNLFIDGCHRVQENESQLEAEIASVLERILDRIHNRSHDMEKQVVALQEMLKTHNSNVIRTIGHSTNTAIQSTQYTKQLEATILQAVGEHKGLEKLSEGLTNVLAGIKVLQNQLGESPAPSVGSDRGVDACPVSSCPDDSAIARNIAAILGRNSSGVLVNADDAGNAIADRLLTVLECTRPTTTLTADAGTPPDPPAVADGDIQRIVERTLEAFRTNSARGFTDDRTDPENSRIIITKVCLNGTNTSDKESTNTYGDIDDSGRVLDKPANENHGTEQLNDSGRVLDKPANEHNGTELINDSQRVLDKLANEHIGTELINDSGRVLDKPANEHNGTEHINDSGRVLDKPANEHHDTELIKDSGRVLDIPANEEHVGETLEYNVTSEDVPTPVEPFVPDAIGTVPTNEDGEDDAQRNGPGANEQTNVVDGEGVGAAGEQNSNADEYDLFASSDNSTETPTDYDFDKASSELDRSEQLYYDELTEENDLTETVQVTVRTLGAVNSSAGLLFHAGLLLHAGNTSEGGSFDGSRNNSDNVVIHPDDKLSTPDRTNTNVSGPTEKENTAGSQTSHDPVFSKFWHRVVSSADLSRETKGREVDGKVEANVKAETNDLDSEREGEDDALDEFGSYVPPSR